MRAWEALSCPTSLRLRSQHPGDRALAVGCSNGTVYVYDDYLNDSTWQNQTTVPHYKLGPDTNPTGEVLWGRDVWLYASTESLTVGAHWAINTTKRAERGLNRLCDRTGEPVSDSGDAMALTADRACI